MMQLTPRDRKLLCFIQQSVRTSGTTPTLEQMRLALHLPSQKSAKDALANLITYLAHREISSFQIAHSIGGDS